MCPEVEIGLGVPRDTIRLVGDAAAPRLVVEKTGEDLTARMRRYARARVTELASLALTATCSSGARPRAASSASASTSATACRGPTGTGVLPRALTERLPLLPVEEEGRLGDPALRENFIERVFAAARWRAFLARRPAAGDLVAFHAAQKFAVLAHSPAQYTMLGRQVAAGGGARLGARLAEYGAPSHAGVGGPSDPSPARERPAAHRPDSSSDSSSPTRGPSWPT